MKTIIRNFVSVLRRFKFATLLNVLGLSVAFAAFAMIMMQIKYDRNFDKCHQDYENIFRVESTSLITTTSSSSVSVNRPLSEQIAGVSAHIKSSALFSFFRGTPFVSVEKDGEKYFFMEEIIPVTPSFTDVYTFDMKEGDSDALKTPNNILIPESMAERFFGKESAIGKEVKLVENKDSLGWVVGGVFKDFPRNSSTKNIIYKAIPDDERKNDSGSWVYAMYIKLDSPDAAADVIAAYDEKYKGDDSYPSIRLTNLLDLHYVKGVEYDMIEKSSTQTLAVLFSIAIIILIIAGINFANFNTALTPMRIKSINTQKILGSTNGLLRAALLSEAVFMTVIAWVISIFLIYILAQTSVSNLIDADMSFTMNYSLWGLTLLVALAVGLLSGLYPSFYMTSFPVVLLLKGSFGLSVRGRRLRNLLVGVQFVSSFVLIIGAMFMSLQNNFMQKTSLGYDKDMVIVTDLNNTINSNIGAFSDKLKSYSEIEDVAFAEILLSSQDMYGSLGRNYEGKNIQFQCLPVSHSFLKVMGIDVREGRDFRQNDNITENGFYIFNEKAKNDFELKLGGLVYNKEIIGFIPDVKYASFRQEISPMAFAITPDEECAYAYIKVKAGANMFSAINNVKSALGSLDGDYPFDVKFYDDVLNKLYTGERDMGMLIILFSVIAVLISTVGVFGLVVFESEYRRKEIGLRKVMGSTVSQILIMFNKTYVKILSICFVIAIPIVYYVISKWLESFVLRTPLYWWVFAAAFLLIFVITMGTVTFQNWRSANENPVKSIKSE